MISYTPARTMYDSTTAADIPTTAEMVAGYVDGAYAWTPADWARFPAAVLVHISTRADGDPATVLDVEQGDATPGQAPGWIERMQGIGIPQPTIYCAASAVSAVRAVCDGLLYWLWVADWTGSPHPVSYAAAVQYANSAQSGGHYDLSIVYSLEWPGPHVTSGDDMQFMGPGPAATNADNIARRVKIHEWHHIPGAGGGKGWPQETEMDRLLALWVAQGAEAVFADILGA